METYRITSDIERIETSVTVAGRGWLPPGVEANGYAERLAEWKPDPVHAARITTRVPCAEFFEVRDRALLAHATQIDPDGAWFACPIEVHQAAWPTEDFELARSHVRTDLPEDDLFAGVRDDVERIGAS